MQEHERNRPTRAHNATNKIQEHDRIPRFCTSCIASTYSGSLFRKRIHVTTLEKRKRLNFCEMKDEKKTNNLEYCVLESVRMLRMLLKKMKNEKKGGGGAEVVEHAESLPTTLEIFLRKWRRYCVMMRLCSLVCVKRWVLQIEINCRSFSPKRF